MIPFFFNCLLCSLVYFLCLACLRCVVLPSCIVISSCCLALSCIVWVQCCVILSCPVSRCYVVCKYLPLALFLRFLVLSCVPPPPLPKQSGQMLRKQDEGHFCPVFLLAFSRLNLSCLVFVFVLFHVFDWSNVSSSCPFLVFVSSFDCIVSLPCL